MKKLIERYIRLIDKTPEPLKRNADRLEAYGAALLAVAYSALAAHLFGVSRPGLFVVMNVAILVGAPLYLVGIRHKKRFGISVPREDEWPRELAIPYRMAMCFWSLSGLALLASSFAVLASGASGDAERYLGGMVLAFAFLMVGMFFNVLAECRYTKWRDETKESPSA